MLSRSVSLVCWSGSKAKKKLQNAQRVLEARQLVAVGGEKQEGRGLILKIAGSRAAVH